MRHSAISIISALLLLALAGCGTTSIAQSRKTEHYRVQLTLDSASFGQRTATIEISDTAGQPVAADQVVITPVMEAMGMTSPEQGAQPIAPGRYKARGEFCA